MGHRVNAKSKSVMPSLSAPHNSLGVLKWTGNRSTMIALRSRGLLAAIFLGFAILGGCSADREVTGHVLVVTKGGREHEAGRGGPPFFRWERFSSGRIKNFRGNEAIQGSPFSLARKRVQAKRSGSRGSKTCKYLTSQSERPTRLVPSTNRKHLACRAIMLLNSRCPYNHGH
jgi:hypothetical protein